MSKKPAAPAPEELEHKRRDLFPRLAQGASFFFLAACLSVTYECVQIHNARADLPDIPLSDASLSPADKSNPAVKPAPAADDDSLLTQVGNFFGLGETRPEKPEPAKQAEVKTDNPAPAVETAETKAHTVVTPRVKALDFNFLDTTKPDGLQTFAVTQRIGGSKVNYSLNLNPGWGEQSRTLVDKSFYHEKEINLFIFAEPPDSLGEIRTDKYQERYAQQEVDKIAATHPMLVPFKFEQQVRSFRFRHWGSFRFVHNGITKLILYTHAGKNGKYSMVISSQRDLLADDMRKIWVSAAETFEVDLSLEAKDEIKESAPGK